MFDGQNEEVLGELHAKIKKLRENYSQTYDIDPTEEAGEIDYRAQSLNLIADGKDKPKLVQQIQLQMDGWIPLNN